MDSKIKAFFQEHLKGDYKIWLIVFILNAFGLVIQFSAKAKLTMDGPLEPQFATKLVRLFTAKLPMRAEPELFGPRMSNSASMSAASAPCHATW